MSGPRCELQELDGCGIFPCGGNSTCRATNDYHRVCDCFPGFTGPLCDVEIGNYLHFVWVLVVWCDNSSFPEMLLKLTIKSLSLPQSVCACACVLACVRAFL